ncbi:MAG TPA: glucuronate isomerase [Clostridiales bacterium]|nr:glucuronate isomerase [Clostridiales bacterium]
MAIRNTYDLRKTIDKVVDEVKITDVHTHLFSTDFGEQLLWGVDELINYHYLVAETMRLTDIPYEKFWRMSKVEQADLIWDTLFIKNSPYSEACRGVLTVLEKLGLNVADRSLNEYRDYFKKLSVDDYIDIVFKASGVKDVVMTNDPFVDEERKVWLDNYKGDSRFKAALRIDPLLNAWDINYLKLKAWGYNVERELDENTLKEIRRFLSEWIDRMKALYMAASLPPEFKVPEESSRSKIIEECIIPVSQEKNVPFAMMIGVKKLINPEIKLAGDGVGKGDVNTVEYLCRQYPNNKFLVTMLARENQHELCIAARKFRNLMIFGCWWFLNNPSLIEEITRMRFELLGTSVIPQHSDARVLDQLIYKWIHSRKIIANVLFDKYSDILATGWVINEDEIIRDVENLFGGNFWRFLD